MTKLTRQQRLGLLLTGILMVLAALLFAIIRPQPTIAAETIIGQKAEQPQKAKKKKTKPTPAPAPTPRKHLDEDF